MELTFNSKLNLYSNLVGRTFNSKLNLISSVGKIFNSKLNVGALRNKTFNSKLEISSIFGTLKQDTFNSRLNLVSSRSFNASFNSILTLTNGVYLVLPVTFGVYEQMFIPAQAQLTSIAATTGTPFSKIGSV